MEKKIVAARAATAVSALAATGAAVAYFRGDETMVGGISELGYPEYFPQLLGAWKLLGAGALVVPVPPTLREWAYAGFTITYTSAIVAHLVRGPRVKAVAPVVALGLLLTSYALRNRSAG